MYALHTATPAFGTRCASLFGLKAETLLLLTGVDYARVNTDPRQGPRQKLPWLVCPDGTTVTDSWNIRRHLEAEAGLTLSRSPHDHLVRRLVEEHLYFAQVWFRWTHHRDRVRDELFSDVAPLLRGLVVAVVGRKVDAALHGQGMGRRPEAEILELVAEDLDAVEAALGGAPWFGGDRPSVADVALHAFLAQLVPTTYDDALVHEVRRRPQLVALHDRVEALVYGADSQPRLRRAS